MNLITCPPHPLGKNKWSVIQQTTLVMRLTIVFTIFVCFASTESLYAQKVSLNVKNVPIESVFESIKKQTGYKFFYQDHILEKIPAITITLKDATLRQALDACLKDQPLSFELLKKTIIIKEMRPHSKTAPKQTSTTTGPVSGIVTDSTGRPIGGVSIRIKGSGINTVTNEAGYFALNEVSDHVTLEVAFIGYKTRAVDISGQNRKLNVILLRSTSLLQAVSVVSTGYQRIPKERATGSFEQIGNDLFNRNVSMNFQDHIKNLNAGVFFNNDANSSEPILIRGRSTIYSNTAPLIVLDNFPYDGDISNLNPNDIENVTILKDAAAASIWGSRAGNGVIVITTKRGTTSKPNVTLNNAVTTKQRPDIKGLPIISSGDYIDLEKTLFADGYYNDEESSDKINNGHPPFTPVIELLRGVRDGTVSAAAANKAIDQLKNYDARKDIEQYMYRNNVVQQHSLGISGNADKTNYYFSAGWDKNLDNLVGKDLDRISLRSQETFKISPAFQIDAGLNFVKNNLNQGNNYGYRINNGAGKALYPYARLVDDQGNAASLLQNYNAGFIQRATEAGLQDWTYNPINDIGYTKNETKITDIVANAGLRYNIIHGLSLELKYQYENQQTRGNINYNSASFYARNLENQFVQIAGDGSISYPIPKGAIVDQNNSELTTHQGRVQLDYHNRFSEKHEITAIAGWEIKNIRSTTNANRYYGFDSKASSLYNQIDYSTQFPQYDNVFNNINIPNYDAVSGTLNRYLSYYTNASYIYEDRYIVSGSAREDGSNLFGVKTNQKTVPLWSAGLAWILNKESFYNVSWLPEIKLRATYGYQGNVYTRASAYATATYDISTNTGLPDATLKNPPNDKLRWERTSTLNLGVDFAFRNHLLSGSIEYYNKHSKDLMGYALIDPTTGIATVNGSTNFFGNLGAMQGKGLDFTLNAFVMKGKFKWNSTYILSLNKANLTAYDVPASPIGNDYLGLGGVNPVIGKPIYALYSYKWGGLDPQNGNPQGYLHNKLSSDYASIIAQTPLDSMVYKGPSDPKVFGSWRNTFTYGNLSLSVNISYKFGYYFRAPSVNYGNLYSTWSGSSDYAKRWQKPGDEKITSVPSMVYPITSARDQFYTFSDILVLKGDQIRLEDISLSYDLNKSTWKRMPFNQIKIYGYASNLGILWKANKSGLDPDYINYPNPGKSFALGVNLIF